MAKTKAKVKGNIGKVTAKTKKATATTTTASKTPRVTYKAPTYDESKYRAGIDTSYYTNAINTYTQQAEQQRATQLGQAGTQRDNALKQAYITRAQNQQTLNNNLAMSGIRGGATETSNMRLANEYGTAVGNANTNYTNSVNSINQSIDQNIADYRADMEARAEEYRQNTAQARWQAEREDSLNEYNAKNEAWNNYYMDVYSGYSEDKAKKALKTAKKKYKNAKTQAQKIRYLQMIRGINNRLGVLANAQK